MANAPHHYEFDTVIVDDQGSSAVSDGVTVHHILIGSIWHRRTPDLATTACGLPFHSAYSPLRRESLVGPICPVCFTPYELAQSERLLKISKEGT